MKKTFTIILVLILACHLAQAQNTVAKLKYEDAEKAFYNGNYQSCISLLDETEKLLGKSAPNILHLRIMAESKVWEADPYGSYEQLETLRKLCDQYLKNYDIAGLEEKYREVYDLQNQLGGYPVSKAEFDGIQRAKEEKQAIAIQEIDKLIPTVKVEGGTFLMGIKDKKELTLNEKEAAKYTPSIYQSIPAHTVSVSPFNMSVYEVSNKVFNEILEKDYSGSCGECPVNVIFEDAQKFVEILSSRTGRNYRLPTEAEWEFAAIGGNFTQGYKFSGSNKAGQVAWHNGNSQTSIIGFKDKTTSRPVGGKMANELGIYDMSGNVPEWCSDWFGPYESTPATNPRGAETGTSRVLRGGGHWYYASWYLNVRFRRLGEKDGNGGIRVVFDD